MRLLLDQNFDRRLLLPLRQAGHNVTVVSINYPPGIPDREVVVIAQREGCLLLTHDRDFGELIIREQLPHAGVIYLRLRRTTAQAKLERLTQVLTDYADQLSRLLAVTDAGVRIR